jgi:hypothetical protein
LETHEEKIAEGESLRSAMKWATHLYQRVDSFVITGHSKVLPDQFPACKHMLRIDDGLASPTYMFEKRDAVKNIYKGGILYTSGEVPTVQQTTQEQLTRSLTWDNLVDKTLRSPLDVKAIVYPDFSTNLNIHYTLAPFSIRGEFRQERTKEIQPDKSVHYPRRFIWGGTVGVQMPRVNAEIYHEMDTKGNTPTDHTTALMALFRPYRAKSQTFSVDFGFDLTARNGDIGNLTGGLRFNYVTPSGRRTAFVVQRTFFDHIQMSYTHELHRARKLKLGEKWEVYGIDLAKHLITNFDLTTSTQFRYLNTDGSSEMTFGMEYRHKSPNGDDKFVIKGRYDTERGAAAMLSKRWYQGWANKFKLDTGLLVANSVPLSHYHQNYWSILRDLRFGISINFEY